ncbi:ABC transporter permease [Occultella aeris]|uniref:Putative D,D-dipeptide transport system permease protein DdpC n=1 Tax=Occultella aeris TaxID=2761496 RepID=A0A7M4DF27_9MICO|nr:ABC transporter permease [Occultella aeris]VZO35520.1 putative D,D-dipeptide transport system permease protein DdpC [Occultella aeris]
MTDTTTAVLLPDAATQTSAPARVQERRVANRLGDGARSLVRRPGLLLAFAVLAVALVAALWPTILTSGDPYAAVPAERMQAPSAQHLFGTDQLGRDLYTRVVHGSALSLSSAALAVVFGLSTGSLVGLVAGFFGGWADSALMRFVDVLLAIPGILLSLAMITALGFGTINVAIAVGVGSVASCARIMRSQVLSVRTSDYVEAAIAGGATRWRVLVRHILPNSAAPVLVLAALDLGGAILAVSSLSFLGFGVQPPTPEWGALVAQGRDYLATAWWLTALPGLTVVATVLAANHIARSLDSERKYAR